MNIKIKQYNNGDIVMNFEWKSCFNYEHDVVKITEYTIGKKYETIGKEIVDFFRKKSAQNRMKF